MSQKPMEEKAQFFSTVTRGAKSRSNSRRASLLAHRLGWPVWLKSKKSCSLVKRPSFAGDMSTRPRRACAPIKRVATRTAATEGLGSIPGRTHTNPLSAVRFPAGRQDPTLDVSPVATGLSRSLRQFVHFFHPSENWAEAIDWDSLSSGLEH
jgi:hypothetical protein